MTRHRITFDRPLLQVRAGGTARIVERALPAPPAEPAVSEVQQTLERVEALLAVVLERIQESCAQREQSLRELQVVAVELAVAAASHLVGMAIDRGEYAVEAVVGEAIERLGLSKPLTVMLHPEDLELLQARIEAQVPEWVASVSLQAESRLQRGDCRIETPGGVGLAAEAGARLADLRRHWIEGLDDAQTERRRDAGSAGPLRRFPDRRETA